LITRIPTGVLSIDYTMRGGFARGRSIELFGGEHTGKTALTLRLLGEAQRLGGKGAYIDCEGTYNAPFAEHLGVDISKLSMHEQVHGHRVVDFMETLLYSREYDVIVMDSIAALLPKSEKENDMEAGSMGMEQAKLMSKAMRKLTTANKKTVLVFINQTREAVGVMFGDKNVTSGGRAMAFYASTRIEMTRIETLKGKQIIVDPKTSKDKEADVPVGHRVLCKIKKEKTGAVNTGSQTTTVFNYGISDFDPIEDLIYVGRQVGVVKNSGDSWWVAGHEEHKSSGRTRFVRWLSTNLEACNEIELECRANIEIFE
jgi:recombination protein RecA